MGWDYVFVQKSGIPHAIPQTVFVHSEGSAKSSKSVDSDIALLPPVMASLHQALGKPNVDESPYP